MTAKSVFSKDRIGMLGNQTTPQISEISHNKGLSEDLCLLVVEDSWSNQKREKQNNQKRGLHCFYNYISSAQV